MTPEPDLGALVEGLAEALIVLDGEQRVAGWLGAAERMLGWTAGEVQGLPIDELLKPVDANGNSCTIGPDRSHQRLPRVKAIPEQELLVTTKKGGEQWVGITCSLQRDGDGRILQTVGVVRDITRRKKIDLAKSEVISAVSHELRSPLTSVKGFTSTLLSRWDRFDDETKKHLLTMINSDADRVTRLIGELLDVSRLEAGRLQLRRQGVDLSEIAARVVSRIRDRSQDHSLSTQVPEGLPMAFADPDKIEQVLTNLVENAVKYTEKGEVGVAASHEGALLRVSVTDQGDGIPPDQRQLVFAKFFRRGERTGSPSGTGLGLYISKGLVEAHGGRIWVEEAPGGGAAFSFTIPVMPMDEDL